MHGINGMAWHGACHAMHHDTDHGALISVINAPCRTSCKYYCYHWALTHVTWIHVWSYKFCKWHISSASVLLYLCCISDRLSETANEQEWWHEWHPPPWLQGSTRNGAGLVGLVGGVRGEHTIQCLGRCWARLQGATWLWCSHGTCCYYRLYPALCCDLWYILEDCHQTYCQHMNNRRGSCRGQHHRVQLADICQSRKIKPKPSGSNITWTLKREVCCGLLRLER